MRSILAGYWGIVWWDPLVARMARGMGKVVFFHTQRMQIVKLALELFIDMNKRLVSRALALDSTGILTT